MPATYTFKKDEVDFVPKGRAFLKRDLSLREGKKTWNRIFLHVIET